ncbi:MAG: phosphoserine phosphatase SerB [Proteobacteria bacterium]|nr:phosphoserine phosphatase SerB [Pseudomonadota bacterium]
MSGQKTTNTALLITAKGEDAPGITAALTTALANSGTKILDIEQVVIHNLLTLSILVEVKEGEKNPLLKDLLFQSKKLDIDIDCHLVPEEETVNNQHSSNTYVITCLGDDIPTKVISKVTTCLYEKGTNIEKISKLAWGKLNCLEIIAGSKLPIPLKELTGYFVPISHESGVDIAVQRENLFRKAKRLVVMDMDSTLIQVEVIDELAACAGIGGKVSAITERAMNGEIDFSQSLRERVALLEGLDEKALDEVYRSLPLTSGAESLIKVLKSLGYKTAVISGGFDYFTDRLKEHLGLDYAFSNRLEIKDGKLTGRVIGDIVDGARKAEILEEIAKGEGFLLDQVIAIGDGANDLPMLGKAGLGIAFNAKKTVREAANYSISQKSLDSILYLLGINEKELNELT